MKLRALSYVIVFMAGIVACALWHRDPPPAPLTPEVEREIEDAGFDATVSTPPVIRDAPRHTRPVAVVSGGISFGPEAPPAVSPPSSCPGPWTLTQDDLAGDCVAEIVEAGEHPFARIWWTGRARTPAGIVERTERVPDVTFAWSPPAVPLRRSAELRVGVSSRLEAVAGGTFYGAGRRIGAWAEASSSGTVAGGVAFRFR